MKTKWTLPMGITINRHLHDGWDLCVNIRVLGHGSVLTYRVTGYENLYSFKPYPKVTRTTQQSTMVGPLGDPGFSTLDSTAGTINLGNFALFSYSTTHIMTIALQFEVDFQ